MTIPYLKISSCTIKHLLTMEGNSNFLELNANLVKLLLRNCATNLESLQKLFVQPELLHSLLFVYQLRFFQI